MTPILGRSCWLPSKLLLECTSGQQTKGRQTDVSSYPMNLPFTSFSRKILRRPQPQVKTARDTRIVEHSIKMTAVSGLFVQERLRMAVLIVTRKSLVWLVKLVWLNVVDWRLSWSWKRPAIMSRDLLLMLSMLTRSFIYLTCRKLERDHVFTPLRMPSQQKRFTGSSRMCVMRNDVM